MALKWYQVPSMRYISTLILCLNFHICPASHANPAALKAVYISLDGLNPKHLEQVAQETSGPLRKNGLFELYSKHLMTAQLRPVMPALTATNHASLITGTMPWKHGISGNMVFDGDTASSGFEMPLQAESLFERAAANQWRILNLAFPFGSLHKDLAEMTGISFPEDRYLGSRVEIPLRWISPTPTLVTPDASTFFMEDVAISYKIRLILNQSTGESRELLIRVYGTQDQLTEAILDDDQDDANGVLARLSLADDHVASQRVLFKEMDTGSPLYQKTRLVWFGADKRGGAVQSLSLSNATYNNAYPPAFADQLEKAQMIWPGRAIGFVAELSDYLQQSADLDRFLIQVGKLAMQNHDFELLTLYQPLLDKVGHGFEADIHGSNPPKIESWGHVFKPSYELMDQHIADLLQDASDDAVISISGDHGMIPVQKRIYLPFFKDPQGLRFVNLAASWGIQMKEQADPLPAQALEWFAQLKTWDLASLTAPRAMQLDPNTSWHPIDKIYTRDPQLSPDPWDFNQWPFGDVDAVIVPSLYTAIMFFMPGAAGTGPIPGGCDDSSRENCVVSVVGGGTHGYHSRHQEAATAWILRGTSSGAALPHPTSKPWTTANVFGVFVEQAGL